MTENNENKGERRYTNSLEPPKGGFRSFIFKYFGTLFMEKKGSGKYEMSLGRVVFFILFCADLYIWLYKNIDIHNGMLTLTGLMVAHIFGTKLTNAIKGFNGKKDTEIPLTIDNKPNDIL